MLLALVMLAYLPGVRADETMADMNSVTSEVLLRSDRSWNGSQLPVYSSGQPEISLVRVTIPPGVRLPMHVHPHATAGVLLRGALRVFTPDGISMDIEAGDPVIEVVGEPHTGENVGSEEAVILVFYAGIKGESVTRRVDD
ncbi:MAG: cupin domain-containing protein [Cellvibrionales bacterium]|jgi:quercetin dioxygenase-like cupin family protein